MHLHYVAHTGPFVQAAKPVTIVLGPGHALDADLLQCLLNQLVILYQSPKDAGIAPGLLCQARWYAWHTRDKDSDNAQIVALKQVVQDSRQSFKWWRSCQN